MEYTKEVKSRIKSIIHDAFGDYVKNVQLSTEDYREELDRIANGILNDTAAPEMYEALKAILNTTTDAGAYEMINRYKYVLAKAEGK